MTLGKRKIEIEVDVYPGEENTDDSYLATDLGRLYIGPNRVCVRVYFDRVTNCMMLGMSEGAKTDGSILWRKAEGMMGFGDLVRKTKG